MADREEFPEPDPRIAQGCPAWCGGSDHIETEVDAGHDPINPEHFGSVAAMGFVQVIVTKPCASLQAATVTIQEKTTRVFGLKSHEARALGAWLVRAADLIDYEGQSSACCHQKRARNCLRP